MTRDRLKADTLYHVSDTQLFFYTPDAVGGYWYDTALEVIDAGFGDYPVHHIQTLTDF